MKLLLIVCVLALAATPGQAQNPSSFRVLDKINGILEKELNVLNGDSSQMSSQVALRGTSQNFMQVGGNWDNFSEAAKKKYKALKDSAKDASQDIEKGMVWAKGKLEGNPYKWMAFKVGVSVVTTIFCPPCALAAGIGFWVIDSALKMSDLKDKWATVNPALSDEAKAACNGLAGTKALLAIVSGGINIFVPLDVLPFTDVGTAIGGKAAEVLGKLNLDKFIEAGTPLMKLLSGTSELMGKMYTALKEMIKGAIAGAGAEKSEGEIDKMLVKINKAGAKLGAIKCDAALINSPAEASAGMNGGTAEPMFDGNEAGVAA